MISLSSESQQPPKSNRMHSIPNSKQCTIASAAMSCPLWHSHSYRRAYTIPGACNHILLHATRKFPMCVRILFMGSHEAIAGTESGLILGLDQPVTYDREMHTTAGRTQTNEATESITCRSASLNTSTARNGSAGHTQTHTHRPAYSSENMTHRHHHHYTQAMALSTF